MIGMCVVMESSIIASQEANGRTKQHHTPHITTCFEQQFGSVFLLSSLIPEAATIVHALLCIEPTSLGFSHNFEGETGGFWSLADSTFVKHGFFVA